MAADRDGPPVVETRGLAKRYGPLAALDGIDLSVPAGQTIVLLGANGAGKSTLLRLLATLTRPSGGRLRLFGEEVVPSDAGRLRSRIGFLSHQTFLYEHLTGLENLLFYARLYGLPDPGRAAREAIDAARLSDRQEDRVGVYSRGMQQRLAIARSLLHGPEMVLLDEPFTGLDRESSARLEERLRQLRSAGRTCVMATHDLEQGLRVADRVLVLRHGRLELDAPARGLDSARLETLLATPGSVAGAGPA
ncbi:MAG TPA: ABC transporter ATP-binding protein [Candidatus Dormibacteraeota bacterium]|nr:ABC transporter ATP-binding protein [Candidatus Dormibacteraeota bacterium]